ncbi:hypothetical protein HDZ31DRAFT_83137 [Schizophyllum fasciatum]
MSGHHHRSDRYYPQRATPSLEHQQNYHQHHQPYTAVQASSYQSGYPPAGQRGYSSTYSQWPANDTQMSSAAYPNVYDYPYQPTDRVSSPYGTTTTSSDRRLPPLDISGSDRWSTMAYGGGSTTSGLDTSMRSNPSSYTSANYGSTYHGHHSSSSGAAGGYSYGHGLSDTTSSYTTPTPPIPRPSSASVRAHVPSSHHAPTSYSPPPPISPTSEADQNAPVKKKRKRADANQLRVLNDVYARTAFPSTEERHQLAKQLDMSPRSVQIWFQNKRQAMRSTHRQTHNAASSGMTLPSSMPDPMPAQSSAGGVTRTTSTRRGRSGY